MDTAAGLLILLSGLRYKEAASCSFDWKILGIPAPPIAKYNCDSIDAYSDHLLI